MLLSFKRVVHCIIIENPLKDNKPEQRVKVAVFMPNFESSLQPRVISIIPQRKPFARFWSTPKIERHLLKISSKGFKMPVAITMSISIKNRVTKAPTTNIVEIAL